MLLLWSLLLPLLLGAPEPVPEWQGECTPGGGTRSARRGWGSKGVEKGRTWAASEGSQGGRVTWWPPICSLSKPCTPSSESRTPFLAPRRILQASAPGAQGGAGPGLAGNSAQLWQRRLGGGSERQLPRIVYSGAASLGYINDGKKMFHFVPQSKCSGCAPPLAEWPPEGKKACSSLLPPLRPDGERRPCGPDQLWELEQVAVFCPHFPPLWTMGSALSIGRLRIKWDPW